MITRNIKGYVGQEIPTDVPHTEYYSYITKNIRPQAFNKPKTEWAESDWKEFNSWWCRLIVANNLREVPDYETLNDIQRAIIEICRNGTDLDSSDNELDKLLK